MSRELDSKPFSNGLPKKASTSEVTLGEPLDLEEVSMKETSSESKSEESAEAPVPVSLGRLFHYADTKDRWLLALGMLTALLTSAVLPITVVLFGEVTDAMASFGLNSTSDSNRDDFVTSMDWFVYGILVVSVYQVLTSLAYVFCLYYSATRQAKRIKLMFLRSALRQEIAWYDNKVMGDFTTRVTEDLRKIEEGIGEKLGMILVNVSMFVIGLVMAFYHGWELTLVVLSFMPLVLLAAGFMGKMQASFAAKEAQAYSTAGAVAEEVIGAIRTVMAFGGEQKEADRYAAGLKGATRATILRSVATALGVGSVWLVQFASFTLAFWYGTKLVVDSRESGDGEYAPGDLVIVFFSILIGAMSVGQTAPQAEAVSSARGAASSVFATIEKKSEIDPSSTEGEKPDTVEGLIEFKDVHFNYPTRPDSQVLRGTSFSVRPGQTVALVGASGCGKSTCIQLIQRFYDPLSGEVLLDGRPLRQLNVSWLRQQIGVVSQEPVLFGTSITENIRYGSPGCSMKEIEKAARDANAYDFIQELPLQFDTLVGQKGAQLSGGQKQRIAIARALVRNPRVFLLDEATSALDLRSEAVVQEALDKARSGRTTIVVAHRLSTVRTADLICALQDGRVAEVGSHQELMQRKGVYHGLVTSQTAGKLEAEEDVEDDDVVVEGESVRPEINSSRGRLITVSSSHASETGAGDDDHVEIISNGTRASFSAKAHANAKSAMLEDEDYEASLPPVSSWRILSMNRWEWPYLLIGSVGSAVMGTLLPAYAVVFGVVLGNLSESDPEVAMENAKLYGLLFLAVGAVAFIATFLQMFMFGVAGERLTTRMRNLAFSALLRQEVSYFDDVRHSVGVLCARLSGDASALQGATGSRLANVTQAVFTVLLGLALAFYLSWQLALASAPFVPLCALATYLESRMNSGSAVAERSEAETGNQIAVEAIANIRTVAGLGLEDMFTEQYRKRLEISHHKDARKAALRGLVYGVAVTVPTVAYAAVFGVGKPLVLNGTVPYQNLFMVTESLIYGTMVVGAAVAFSPDFNKAFDAAKRLFALLDRVPAIDASLSSGLKPLKLRGDMALKKVQFRYPTRPDAAVLRGLNLRVQPGQTVALVGASGCGKSTCIQLLQRLYDADAGDVMVDDQNVSTLNLRWLRSHIGIVSQEPTLFDKTIRENIAYGDCTREVPMDEIIAAARDANIHQFVTSLPAGYETQLGSSSSTQLSGGQKQRIAIARALVRRPGILLLDEATSALDAESEKVVQEALDRAASGRTCLVIAHRLSTIQGADVIAVIHKGRVVEQGTHQQLLANKHMYYQLYKTMA